MGNLSRRAALQGLGVGLGSIAIGGCGADGTMETGAPEGETPNGNGNGNAPPAASTTPTPPNQPDKPIDVDPPKLTPKELLAGIDHIVVLMMENRSFDHFLGALASDAAYASKALVEGLKGTEANPSSDGTTMVPVFKMANFTPEDPPHGWAAAHNQFNEGKNDGFVKAHAGASEKEAMGYHDRSQIPLYYWFADNFAICDHWFASVMGPTWPNRFYLHAATSKGKKGNDPLLLDAPETIWDALKEKNITAKNYAAGLAAFFTGGFPTKAFGNTSASVTAFFDAAKAGTLPAFSMIDPDYQASDDHPAHNIQRGQAFVASVYKALSEGPKWSKTLFIITYDENGGFYDHVAPPKTKDDLPEFEQLGFRVPAFVIGPMVKKGYVSKVQMEHSSVAQTLRTRWDIKSLTQRMAASNDITDCIDPVKVKSPPNLPPGGMPQTAITMQAALYDGVGVGSQPKLDEMVRLGQVQAVNSANHQERIGDWLEHAVRLGAVRIVGS
jgi:phospholipase C